VALLAVIAFGPGAANEGDRGTPTGLAGVGGATRVPASTALPTASPAPTLTPTPVEVAACPGLRLIGFSKKGNEVSWTIDNTTGSPVQLASLDFRWPASNPAYLISLDGQPWLEKADIERMVEDMAQGLNPQIPFSAQLSVPDDEIRRFTMRFNWTLDEAGIYGLELGFDPDPAGCYLTTEW
jgi:hypothetical protein